MHERDNRTLRQLAEYSWKGATVVVAVVLGIALWSNVARVAVSGLVQADQAVSAAPADMHSQAVSALANKCDLTREQVESVLTRYAVSRGYMEEQLTEWIAAVTGNGKTDDDNYARLCPLFRRVNELMQKLPPELRYHIH
jgi:hypothetical protein